MGLYLSLIKHCMSDTNLIIFKVDARTLSKKSIHPEQNMITVTASWRCNHDNSIFVGQLLQAS